MSGENSKSVEAPDGSDQFHARGPQPAEDGSEIMLSLCLIVKDEESRLPTLLDSTKDWVDELVVVDTGSQDKTVEIAENYGARVFHHPWEDSFSKARNQSLNYARGRWVFIMDADEELDAASGPRLRPLLNSLNDEIGAIFFRLYNYLPSGQGSWALQPRIFRNVEGFCYRGTVHNEAVLQGKPLKSDLTVIHYGYDLDPETMASKHQRRLRMIRSWIEREPNHLAPHAYLAQTLISDPSPEARSEAVEEAKIALHLAAANDHNVVDYPRCYYPLIGALYYLERDEEAQKYALECIEKIPYYPDPYHFLCYLAMKYGRLEDTCQWARRFMETHAWADAHPENFRFIEILTVEQKGQNLYRWSLAAAMLGRGQEAAAAFEQLAGKIGDERWTRMALQGFLANNLLGVAAQMAAYAKQAQPQWDWVDYYLNVAMAGEREKKAQSLRKEAERARGAGDTAGALQGMQQALELTPEDGITLLFTGELLRETDQAAARNCLMKGLSAYMGGARHWRALGDILFEEGDYRGARAVYRRCLAIEPDDARTQARLKTARRRLGDGQDNPTVAQKPPGMIIFLASGLSRDQVLLGAPHFLMNRAWGGLSRAQDDRVIRDLAHWATLYTGQPPENHKLLDQKDQIVKSGVLDLPLVTLWEIMARERSLGLLAAPLCSPPLGFQGWCAAGPPHGLLDSELVEPSSLAPVLLANGFRHDFLINEFEGHVFAHKLVESRVYEAQCYESERAKFRAALEMPAVDVLVLGYHFLDRMHPHLAWDGNRMFSAYQQFYGWVDAVLAALQPEDFVILGQRGYSKGSKQPDGEAFYCLSWLKGENRSADPTQVAPQILARLGLDPAALGRPRS